MLIFISILVVLLVCWVIYYNRDSSDVLRTPPIYPGALPLLGHAHIFTGRGTRVFWEFTRNLSKYSVTWGSAVIFRIGICDVYLLSDPDDIVTVANNCLEKNVIYDFMKPLLGEGLLSGAAPIWKVHRKLLNPAFYQPVLDGFIDVFNQQSQILVETMKTEIDRKPFDSWHYIGNNALLTIFLTTMGGHHGDENLCEKYMRATEGVYNNIITRFQTFWLHSEMLYNWSSLKKTLDSNAKIAHDLSDAVIRDVKERIKTDHINKAPNGTTATGTKCKTFVELILEYSKEQGILTDEETRDEIDTIIIAGHDTSASTTINVLIMLGTYPEIQERVFQEVNEVLGDRPLEKKDYSKLVFLEAVIKETLRLYPIAPFVGRRTTQALSLKKCTIPANKDIFLNFYGLHRDKSIWGEDAEEFRPDRWLDKARLPEHHAAFAGFSIGRRMCIGKNYALMAMKTNLSYLIRNYRVTADASKLELKLDIMLKPIAGHYISIKNRN